MSARGATPGAAVARHRGLACAEVWADSARDHVWANLAVENPAYCNANDAAGARRRAQDDCKGPAGCGL
jgi:hypothetical protein